MLPFGYNPENYGGKVWWNENNPEMRRIWGTQEEYDNFKKNGGTWDEYENICRERAKKNYINIGEKKDEQQYAYWDLNVEDAMMMPNGEKQVVFNCSACGHESPTLRVKTCPVCAAIMVEPLLSKTDIYGRDICAGDIVRCNIDGYDEKVKGTVSNEGQWHLTGSGIHRFIYECDNFEIIKGTIPEGHYLNKDYLNKMHKIRK